MINVYIDFATHSYLYLKFTPYSVHSYHYRAIGMFENPVGQVVNQGFLNTKEDFTFLSAKMLGEVTIAPLTPTVPTALWLIQQHAISLEIRFQISCLDETLAFNSLVWRSVYTQLA